GRVAPAVGAAPPQARAAPARTARRRLPACRVRGGLRRADAGHAGADECRSPEPREATDIRPAAADRDARAGGQRRATDAHQLRTGVPGDADLRVPRGARRAADVSRTRGYFV